MFRFDTLLGCIFTWLDLRSMSRLDLHALKAFVIVISDCEVIERAISACIDVATSPFLDTGELKIHVALRARKVSGAFEKRAPAGP